jgi:hypothetical protein
MPFSHFDGGKRERGGEGVEWRDMEIEQLVEDDRLVEG